MLRYPFTDETVVLDLKDIAARIGCQGSMESEDDICHNAETRIQDDGSLKGAETWRTGINATIVAYDDYRTNKNPNKGKDPRILTDGGSMADATLSLDEIRIESSNRSKDTTEPCCFRAALKVISGQNYGKQYFFDKSEIQLGRSNHCDIRVKDPAISNYHAIIFLEQRQYYIDDMNSKNGTYINGIAVDKWHLLQYGDFIRIGDTTLRFITDDSEPLNQSGLQKSCTCSESSADLPFMKQPKEGLMRILGKSVYGRILELLNFWNYS